MTIERHDGNDLVFMTKGGDEVGNIVGSPVQLEPRQLPPIRLSTSTENPPQIVQDVELILNADGRARDINPFECDVNFARLGYGHPSNGVDGARRPHLVIVLRVFEVDGLVHGGEGACRALRGQLAPIVVELR